MEWNVGSIVLHHMEDEKINTIEAAAGFVALAAILAVQLMFIAQISGDHGVALPLIAKLISHLWFGH
jgi:hypothetical protein